MPTSSSPETRIALLSSDLQTQTVSQSNPSVPPPRCSPRAHSGANNEAGFCLSHRCCVKMTREDSGVVLGHAISPVHLSLHRCSNTRCHQVPANSSFCCPSSVRPSCPAPPLRLLFRQSHTSCHSSLLFL